MGMFFFLSRYKCSQGGLTANVFLVIFFKDNVLAVLADIDNGVSKGELAVCESRSDPLFLFFYFYFLFLF